MSKILPWLYLGSKNDAMNIGFLTNNHITVVINVAVELQHIIYPNVPVVVKIGLYDDPEEDINMYFDYIYRCMKLAELRNQNVLIHCAAGISRSSTFVAHYLMRDQNMKLTEAIRYMRKIRKQVRPNDGFMHQLHSYKYSKDINGINND